MPLRTPETVARARKKRTGRPAGSSRNPMFDAGQRERAFGNVHGYIGLACTARYSTREVPTEQASVPRAHCRLEEKIAQLHFPSLLETVGRVHCTPAISRPLSQKLDRATPHSRHVARPYQLVGLDFKHHQQNKRGAGNREEKVHV